MMRIGISIGTSFDTGGPDGHRAGAGWVLAQARAARRAGLDHLTVGDHHATGPGGYLQNVAILGRLAAEWDGPMGCLFLVPLWNPVLMAEQIATLATMAAGPFIVQSGLGGGAGQFAAMGVDMGRRVALFEEGVRVARGLLSGEVVESESLGMRGARIAPLPPEGTEWWMGGGVDRAIDRAARLGDCWYANADLTPPAAARALGVYREACERHGRRPVRLPIRRDVFVAERAADAEAVGDALIASGYRGFDRAAVAYGDPDGVAEQLAPLGEMGFTDIVIRTMAPLPESADPEAAHRSVELAGEVRARLG